MDHTLEIPLFPLGTVLFPAGLLPLRIFEPRYVEMTRACIRDNSVFGVTLIRAGYEVGKPAVPCDIGCTARIVEWQESVFRIRQRRTMDSGLIVGRVELREPADPAPLPERHEKLAELLRELIEQIGQEHFPRPWRLGDAAWVGNRLCELLPVEPERKQKLLETAEPLTVLDEVEQLMRQLRQDRDDAG